MALSDLPVLQKPHSPFTIDWIADEADIEQCIRICRSATIHPHTTQEHVDKFKTWCDRHNGEIDIHYSPPQQVPPPTATAEVTTYTAGIVDALSAAKALLGGYPVRRVIIDFESWYASGAESHDNEMQRWHTMWRDISWDIFPDSPVEWYGYGAVQYAATKTGFNNTPWFVHKELVSHSTHVSLYSIWEYRQNLEQAQRSLKEPPAKQGANKLVPWVALGSGYVFQIPTPTNPQWVQDYNYSLGYSKWWGSAINNPWANSPDREEAYGPFRHTEFVCLYPGFLHRDYPSWPAHFEQYVLGAHNLS